MPLLKHSSIFGATIVKSFPATIETMVANTYQERLCDAMDEAGISTSELASQLGISYQAVKKAREGQTKSLSAANNAAAAGLLGVSQDWLARGIGPKRPLVTSATKSNSNSESNGRPETARPVPSGSRIPVVGRARLGDNGHFVELEYPVGHGDGYIDLPSNDPNAYALRCEGDSMLPRIRHSEFVIVEPNRAVQPGDEVLVKARDGRVMVKQFLYRRDDRVTLLSVNEAHPPVSIEAADIEAMHYVSAIVKSARWRPS